MDPLTNLSQDANDQVTDGAESGAEEHAGGGESETIVSDGGVQPLGEEGNTEALGNTNLPPELKEAQKKLLQDYHTKMQKLAADRRQIEQEMGVHKQNSQTLGRLMDEGWFKKAYEAEKARLTGAVSEELTDEQMESFRDNPKAQLDYLRKYLSSMLENQLGPKLNAAERELTGLKTERVKEQLASTYKDFKPALEAGHLDKYLKNGADLEGAYALWKVREGSASSKSDVLGEAERLLAARKQGAVEKPGSNQPKGAEKVYKARSLHDALDKAFAARERGETNFRIVKG